MALSNFQKAITEITGRNGNVFASDDSGVNWYHLGILRETAFKAPPRNTSRDNSGREFQYGYDVEITMVLMQSALARAADYSSLIDDAGNGIDFKLTERPSTTAGAGAADGIELQNAIATVSPEFNYSDAESGVTITIRGYLPKDAFDGFTSGGGTLVFDQ